jgi:sodium-dependent dicarboxylate transporter 2/3/5
VERELQLSPGTLLIPATLAASCGFMLPVATPPNAIAFATGRVPMRAMLRAGLALDVIGVLVISGVFLMLGHLVMPDASP